MNQDFMTQLGQLLDHYKVVISGRPGTRFRVQFTDSDGKNYEVNFSRKIDANEVGRRVKAASS